MLATYRAKLFMNGRSQAVRIPSVYRFKNVRELKIIKQGQRLILEPLADSWSPFLNALNQLPEDFNLKASPTDFSKKEIFE